MGPYVICDTSRSGAICLFTLDGDAMTNWLSGCQIYRYHEPMTHEMLGCIHDAKEHKC